MKNLRFQAVAMAVALLVVVLETPVQGAKVPKQPGERGAAGRGPRADEFEYAVVQIDDEFQVVTQLEGVQMKKVVAEEDKKKQKAYDDAKKNAVKAKSKTKSTKGKTDAAAPPEEEPLEKPTKRKVKVVEEHIKSMPEAEQIKMQWQDGTRNAKNKKTPAP